MAVLLEGLHTVSVSQLNDGDDSFMAGRYAYPCFIRQSITC